MARLRLAGADLALERGGVGQRQLDSPLQMLFVQDHRAVGVMREHGVENRAMLGVLIASAAWSRGCHRCHRPMPIQL